VSQGDVDYLEFVNMIHGESPFGWTKDTKEGYDVTVKALRF
jgi:hypothetical protein